MLYCIPTSPPLVILLVIADTNVNQIPSFITKVLLIISYYMQTFSSTDLFFVMSLSLTQLHIKYTVFIIKLTSHSYSSVSRGDNMYTDRFHLTMMKLLIFRGLYSACHSNVHYRIESKF